MTTGELIAFGGLIIGVITVVVTILIDWLNARRTRRNKKLEILSQLSKESFKGYRVIKAYIVHDYGLDYYMEIYHKTKIHLLQLTDSKNKIEMEKEKMIFYDQTNIHRSEREQYSILMNDIDAELGGLKTMFSAFFKNSKIIKAIEDLIRFKYPEHIKKFAEYSKDKTLSEIVNEANGVIDEKYFPYVKTLNEEITKEIKKI